MDEQKELNRVYLSKLDRVFTRIAEKLVPLVPEKVTPNQITFVSSIIGILAAVFFYLAGLNRWYFIGAFVCIFVHTVLDFIDGSVARQRGLGSKAGAFFDFFSDCIVVIFMFIGIGFSTYASWYIMAFPIILYVMHSLLIKLYEEGTGQTLFPSFGDCELFLSLIIVSVLTFILNNQPLKVLGMALQPFDVILGIMTVYSTFELFALAFKLFRRLKREESSKV